jgi:hypothetical protein
MRPANSVNTFGDRALRHAGRDRLLFQIGEEAVEAHAGMTGCAACGRCGKWLGRSCNWFAWSRSELG